MKALYFFPAIAMMALATACSDSDEIVKPEAAIEVDSYQLDVNQSLTLHFTGQADNVVVFPGDEGQDFELLNEGNSGLVVNKGLFTYSYTKPGAYHIVCVASNNFDEGNVLLTDTCSVWVTVSDDITEINRLSAVQVLNVDEIYATQADESGWVLALPAKMKIGNKEANVALKQRLKFYIASETTELTVNGEPYAANTRYDLSDVVDISTRSNKGSVRDYKLYTLPYGEFKSFELAGVKGSLSRTPYDYSSHEINITLPAGTDLKSLAPQFTLTSANQKAFIGEKEQISAVSAVDFSSPVTYRIVTTSANNPEISVESTCTVNVTIQ